MTHQVKRILITGATGNQGGAIIQELLTSKEQVEIHALSRNPDSKPARKLAKQNIKIIQGDLGKKESLDAIKGFYDFIFFVTDFWAGKDLEIRFGQNIIKSFEGRCGHFIFSSTPSSVDENVFSFSDSKYQIEKFLKTTSLTYSIIRPGLFMELFKNLKFAPPIILGMMLKNIHHDKGLPFVSLKDIGKVVVKIIENKNDYINSDFNVITQYISLNQIKQTYKEVKGRYPLHFALPNFVFKKVVGSELYDLWNWLDTKETQYNTEQYRRIIHNKIDFRLFFVQSRLPI